MISLGSPENTHIVTAAMLPATVDSTTSDSDSQIIFVDLNRFWWS